MLVEMDGGMVPIVTSAPEAADRRKGKTLNWQELKLCIARELGSAPGFMAERLTAARNRPDNTCTIVPVWQALDGQRTFMAWATGQSGLPTR